MAANLSPLPGDPRPQQEQQQRMLDAMSQMSPRSLSNLFAGARATMQQQEPQQQQQQSEQEEVVEPAVADAAPPAVEVKKKRCRGKARKTIARENGEAEPERKKRRGALKNSSSAPDPAPSKRKGRLSKQKAIMSDSDSEDLDDSDGGDDGFDEDEDGEKVLRTFWPVEAVILVLREEKRVELEAKKDGNLTRKKKMDKIAVRLGQADIMLNGKRFSMTSTQVGCKLQNLQKLYKKCIKYISKLTGTCTAWEMMSSDLRLRFGIPSMPLKLEVFKVVHEINGGRHNIFPVHVRNGQRVTMGPPKKDGGEGSRRSGENSDGGSGEDDEGRRGGEDGAGGSGRGGEDTEGGRSRGRGGGLGRGGDDSGGGGAYGGRGESTPRAGPSANSDAGVPPEHQNTGRRRSPKADMAKEMVAGLGSVLTAFHQAMVESNVASEARQAAVNAAATKENTALFAALFAGAVQALTAAAGAPPAAPPPPPAAPQPE